MAMDTGYHYVKHELRLERQQADGTWIHSRYVENQEEGDKLVKYYTFRGIAVRLIANEEK